MVDIDASVENINVDTLAESSFGVIVWPTGIPMILMGDASKTPWSIFLLVSRTERAFRRYLVVWGINVLVLRDIFNLKAY